MGGRKVIRSESGDAIPAVRDLEFFLLDFTHRGDVERVSKTLRAVRELLLIYGGLRGHDSDIAARSRQAADRLGASLAPGRKPLPARG